VAVAFNASSPTASGAALRLAEVAADRLNAAVVAVVIAHGAQPIVWDVRPVPEFRGSQALGVQTVEDAIAGAVVARLGALAPPRATRERRQQWLTVAREGMHHGVAVSA
jgi:hypothetical protein